MASRYDNFPLQEKPLYDFYISDGALIQQKYVRYKISQRRGKDVYWIYTGCGIKAKEMPNQLGRVLNNHLWTFDPDPLQAVRLFQERAENDEALALAMLESARKDKSEAQSACQKILSKGKA